ncbi:hypothetical protein BH23CHL2_BH23CHL2_35020 [soil metagenome]
MLANSREASSLVETLLVMLIHIDDGGMIRMSAGGESRVHQATGLRTYAGEHEVRPYPHQGDISNVKRYQ